MVDSKFKRFMAFQYNTYYPDGGLGDCEASFDTFEEAVEFLKKRYHDFRFVFDRIEGTETEVN